MNVLKRLLLSVGVIWIAHWTATWDEPSVCVHAAQVDPYTGRTLDTMAATACMKRRTEDREQRFETKDEAMKFIMGCPTGVCSKWTLEEVHL